MKGKILAVLYSYGAMASIGMVLGLLTGGFPRHNSLITMLSLVVVMSLSTREVKFKKLRSLKSHMRDFLVVFLLNYGLLSFTFISLGYLLFNDLVMIQGMVVFAVVPSAVAVIPFTKMLDGDTELSLISSSLLYLSSLIIAPTVLFLLFSKEVNIISILMRLFQLIILPLIISRILLWVGYEERKEDDVVVNFAFLLIIFGAMGANRQLFLSRIDVLSSALLIGFVRSIVLATLVLYVCRSINVKSDKLRSFVLFSSYKNGGLAIIFAATLFGVQASFPIVAGFPFDIILMIYLKRWVFSGG